ncbi:MAG TPA: hypothetical protein VF142_16950 [Longimicrobium sp.]
MNKLSLTLDDLRVETFATSPAPAGRGTVVGNLLGTVNGNTCAPSCPYTCGIIPQTENCRAGHTHDCPACV